MDIQTRDGILLRNIPDGTPDEAIKARIAKIRASASADAEKRATKRLQEQGSVMVPPAVSGEEPLPPLSQRLTDVGMAGMRGATSGGGPMGGIMGAASEGFKQSGEALNRGAYKAGGAVTDVLAPHVPPEVAAGAGYATNVAGQAIPTVIGGLVGPGAQRAITAPFKAAGRMARNVVDPWTSGGIERAVGRTAVEAAGPKRQAVIEALKRNQQIVPRSMPTAGEAAAPAGSAEFSGLQRVVEGKQPSAFFGRATEQESARAAALRSFGKTPADITAAKGAREAIAGPLYKEAFNNAIDLGIDPAKLSAVSAGRKAEFTKLLNTPAIQSSIKEAKELAKNEMLQTGGVKGSVRGLHYAKMAMDDKIKKAVGNEQRILIGLKERFVKTIDALSPQYGAARSTFAEMSKPINQMQVGQELERSLIAPLGATERPAAFAQALRAAPQTLKRATGQPRYKELEEILEPQQMQSVTNVLDDLKRAALHEQLAKAGTEKARDLVGQISPALPQAGMFNPKYSVMRAISNRFAGRVEGKSLERLAEAMQDPVLMAKLMQSASPAERTALTKALRSISGTSLGAGVGASIGYESGRSP